MTRHAGHIVVALDDSGGGRAAGAAVRWAAAEAARRGTELLVVLPDDHSLLPRRRRAFARAVADVRAVAPRTTVFAHRTLDGPLRAERIASAEAAAVVVPGPSPDTDDLIMTAHCPVVVVPTAPVARGLPVLLAAGPATGPEAIDFAFTAAAGRHTGLLAVRTWSDPVVDLGRLAPGAVDRWDDAEARVRRDLTDQLSAWVVAHPGVRVQTKVVNDRCVDLLAAAAGRAELLVMGRPSRGAMLNYARPSPALVLARRAPCPVAVVPPPGPARHHWLPTRRIGPADLRG
jgi:nucleotide-binding universal stress UspA family protein